MQNKSEGISGEFMKNKKVILKVYLNQFNSSVIFKKYSCDSLKSCFYVINSLS